MEKRFSSIILALFVAVFFSVVPSSVQAQLRFSTHLSLSPSVFTISSGNSITLTATLTSGGTPLAGKIILFTTTLGSVNPNSGITDSQGKVSVTYTAPQVSVRTFVTITASFAGDISYQPSSITSSGIIEIEQIPPIITAISTQGAAFAIPETIKDDISNFAIAIPQEIQNSLPVPIPTTGFLLANEENLSLVLAQQSDKGLASVKGWKISPKIILGGFQLDVIVAESVSFTKEGTPATVREILANPANYEFDLVKVDAIRRHVSMLYDPDDGTGIEFPVTSGYLVENPVRVPELIKGAVKKGKELISDLSKGTVQDILTQEQNRLPVFDFETDYWIDGPAITHGIVLLPGSRILRLLENVVSDAGKLVRLETDKPILYDVKTDLKSQPAFSVQEIKQNMDTYYNRIVELTVYGYRGTISIQEALRAPIPCVHGLENWIDIPTAGGPICVPVPLDVRLEGMIAWNRLSIPPARDELLLVAGASSHEQDKIFENQLAEFRLVGKIVSTKMIDESLPEGPALIIFKEEKLRNITIQELAMRRIEENLAELNWLLTNFSENTIPGILTRPPPVIVLPVQPIIVPTPESLPKLVYIAKRVEFKVFFVAQGTPINLTLENSSVSNISLTLKQAYENIKIILEKLEEKPLGLPEPPGLVLTYYEISTNVPDDAIENAGITFWVLKERLEARRLSRENVILLRYHAGSWKNLPTEIMGENATHIQYSAKTPGFSTFAITVVKAEEKPVGVNLLLIGVMTGVIAMVVLIVFWVKWRSGTGLRNSTA